MGGGGAKNLEYHKMHGTYLIIDLCGNLNQNIYSSLEKLQEGQ